MSEKAKYRIRNWKDYKAINEEKKLARCPEDPVYQREKPKTQVKNEGNQKIQPLWTKVHRLKK